MFNQQVLDFARNAHEGQTRKYIEIDYIVHPMRVASLVNNYLSKAIDNPYLLEQITSAALLHDTIEDCDVSFDDIHNLFGLFVAEVVNDVTNPSIYSEGLNRKARKEMDKDHLANSSGAGATIKLADIIDNCTDIVAYDKNFAKVYLREKKDSLDILSHGNVDLLALAHKTVDLGLKALEK